MRAVMGVALTQLYVYPIKSAGGVALEEARLDARGIAHDRRWMLVDASGRFMSQRKHPRMALVSTRLSAEHLTVGAPGMPELRLPLRPEDRGERLVVGVWSDAVRAEPVGKEADEWFSGFLGVRCRLVRMPDDAVRPVDPRYAGPDDRVGFADGFPFLLVSEASLEDLGARLGRPVPVDRFRPNLVVSGAGAFAEDGWRRVRVGADGVAFRVAKPCSRCSIVMTDQATGRRDPDVLRTLAGYRMAGGKVLFGQNLVHDGGTNGTLRVGDAVEVY